MWIFRCFGMFFCMCFVFFFLHFFVCLLLVLFLFLFGLRNVGGDGGFKVKRVVDGCEVWFLGFAKTTPNVLFLMMIFGCKNDLVLLFCFFPYALRLF